MVIKEEPNINIEHFIKRAKSIRVIQLGTRIAHTRKCAELREGMNCKITSEKKLSKKESQYYGQVLERQRDRDEKYMKKNLKKKLNKTLIVEGAI